MIKPSLLQQIQCKNDFKFFIFKGTVLTISSDCLFKDGMSDKNMDISIIF